MNVEPPVKLSVCAVFPEMAVALQFRVLQSAIEFIKTTANHEPHKLSSSVHAPSSPHHAIHQKRKSIAGEFGRGGRNPTRFRCPCIDGVLVLISRFHCHERLDYPPPPQAALLLLRPDPYVPPIQPPAPGLPPLLPLQSSIIHAPL